MGGIATLRGGLSEADRQGENPSVRFLFVHQNFPGQFLHIVRHLVATEKHEVLFICEPNQNEIRGVRKIPYTRPPLAIKETHIAARELDDGVRRAEVVFKAAYGLRHLGFTPDIIIGHHGWGEMLNLCDVWPDAPMLGYMEFYYQHNAADVGFDPEFPHDPLDFPRIRAKNAINHIALNLGKSGQTPTEWQRCTYPDWARPKIDLIWEGVNLDVCSPDPRARRTTLKIGNMTVRPSDRLVTYVSRDLEPYRGFHRMMRALPRLMATHKDLKVVMVGGDGISYGSAPRQGGTWREVMLAELSDRIDPDRVAFPGRVGYDVYISLLRRSDAHVYLTYPFVASWSLREALAAGCAVIGSDTEPVREFITDGKNGLLTSFFDTDALVDKILLLLEDKALSRRLRIEARRYAEENLAMADYIAEYGRTIERLTGENPLPIPVEETIPVEVAPTAAVRRRKAA
ncbi:glycosyltransferase family 4 protein [Rhodopila sp.]|jgi:glycosyltransferase involved in cell wall biosynthesis|uniref:glycosyltransferase family 4 protein n=1 Tax=Rhodopila sp. TaxID=2480087 RepID=UPI002CB88A11|nr:glycosyltransferase family 4 protein [Rhodopila sp.]HVZ10483.1 glycosyltransferase family 4 protein [Rhodopila sp.]